MKHNFFIFVFGCFLLFCVLLLFSVSLSALAAAPITRGGDSDIHAWSQQIRSVLLFPTGQRSAAVTAAATPASGKA